MAKKKKDSSGTNISDLQSQGARLVCLEIDQIKLYDRNPRTVRNPEYERIKHSIVNHGLEQPLIVTRRPGDKTYMVKAGGNTRLQILKELNKATGDPCYAMANCIEVGWKDESVVLLGHLRENSLRGNLTFIDQAAAVCAYGEMLAEETGKPHATIKDLRAALYANGLPISDGRLSRMRYAVDALMPAMPVALCDGLGQRTIGEISKLHHNARQLWVRRGIGSADDFNAVFTELCRRNDGPDWQLEQLQRAVELEIAEAADISLQTVRISVDASKFAAMPPPNNADVIATVAEVERPDPGTQTAERGPEGGEQPKSSNKALTLTVSVELDDADERDLATPEVPQNDPFLDLRQRAYGLGRSLAASFHFGDAVIPLPDCGNGFLLADFPDRALLECADADSRAMIGTVWWQLLAFSETGSAPQHIVQERLPTESTLREVLESNNLELLLERVDIIHAPHFAERFWARLPKKEWQDWLYLAHTHRELRGKVIETERPLWPSQA